MTGRHVVVTPVIGRAVNFAAAQLTISAVVNGTQRRPFLNQLNVRAGIAGPLLCMSLTRVTGGGSPRSIAAASSSRTAFTKAERWAESLIRSLANSCAAFTARNALSSGPRLALALAILVLVRGITCSSV